MKQSVKNGIGLFHLRKLKLTMQVYFFSQSEKKFVYFNYSYDTHINFTDQGVRAKKGLSVYK